MRTFSRFVVFVGLDTRRHTTQGQGARAKRLKGPHLTSCIGPFIGNSLLPATSVSIISSETRHSSNTYQTSGYALGTKVSISFVRARVRARASPASLAIAIAYQLVGALHPTWPHDNMSMPQRPRHSRRPCQRRRTQHYRLQRHMSHCDIQATGKASTTRTSIAVRRSSRSRLSPTSSTHSSPITILAPPAFPTSNLALLHPLTPLA